MSLAGVFPRLAELLVEIAAILDHELLRRLVGEVRFAEFKAAADSSGSPDAGATGEHAAAVATLLGKDDLGTFLEALLGNVLKRESLTVEQDVADADNGPTNSARSALSALFNLERPQCRAFVAALAEPESAATLAMEFKRELEQKLVPLLLEVDSVAQFGKVLRSTCSGITSIGDRQPIETALRLLARLQEVLSETGD
jgi:hypothetical protein